jgi:hypothetical protein
VGIVTKSWKNHGKLEKQNSYFTVIPGIETSGVSSSKRMMMTMIKFGDDS